MLFSYLHNFHISSYDVLSLLPPFSIRRLVFTNEITAGFFQIDFKRKTSYEMKSNILETVVTICYKQNKILQSYIVSTSRGYYPWYLFLSSNASIVLFKQFGCWWNEHELFVFNISSFLTILYKQQFQFFFRVWNK